MPRTGSIIRAIYRAVLRLVPRDLRAEYGAEMEALFAECCERERQRRTLWGGRLLCLKGIVDLIGFALRARWNHLTSRSPSDRQTFVMHTGGRPQDAVPAVRTVIKDVDPYLPVSNVRTLDETVSLSLATRRLTMWLLAAFAGLARALGIEHFAPGSHEARGTSHQARGTSHQARGTRHQAPATSHSAYSSHDALRVVEIQQ